MNLNVLPYPSPLESTVISPRFDSTICLTIESPKPIPSLLTFAVRYNLPNLLKSLGKSSYMIPFPVSLMLMVSKFSGSPW